MKVSAKERVRMKEISKQTRKRKRRLNVEIKRSV